MNFKIIKHTYENTGGGCMVGFDEVWLPDENRTVFVHTNEMGCSFFPADTYHGELDDVDAFADFDVTYSPAESCEYLDVARECIRRYLLDEGEISVAYGWLPNNIKEQVTSDYTKWMCDRYEDPDPLYTTDGRKLIMDEEYLGLLDEKRESDSATSKLGRIEVITSFENFKRAYQDVVEIWDKHGDLINDILITHYPFDKSFDELNVARWCDNVVHSLI